MRISRARRLLLHEPRFTAKIRTNTNQEKGEAMTTGPHTIDRGASARRIARDVDTLAGPDFTLANDAIRRYAYTSVYRNTLEYVTGALEELGFTCEHDPVGTMVARNRPNGDAVFGIGSHCDSNRNGGRYDGTMGVVCALEVCRLNHELRLGLPLQVISFLEEEGSGFGQMLLGSRIIAARVTEVELRETFRAIDDGRPFWEHAEEAGYQPGRWREAAHVLDDLVGWIEMHIEQARVLQDTGNRIGIVRAIAGYVHADVVVHGRGDHAGATPMDFRLDPTTVSRSRSSSSSGWRRAPVTGTVGTVGEIEVAPGLINAIADASASHSIFAGRTKTPSGASRHIAVFAENVRSAVECVPSTATAGPARDDPRHANRCAPGSRSQRDRRALPRHGLGCRSRHDVCRRERPERHGLRSLQGRDQPSPCRGSSPRRRRSCRGDHPQRNRKQRIVLRAAARVGRPGAARPYGPFTAATTRSRPAAFAW